MIIQATCSVTARLLSALLVIRRASWSWRKDREKKILSLFLSLSHSFLFMCISVLSVYMCTMCVSNAHGGQKVTEPRRLELQMTMSLSVGAGN